MSEETAKAEGAANGVVVDKKNSTKEESGQGSVKETCSSKEGGNWTQEPNEATSEAEESANLETIGDSLSKIDPDGSTECLSKSVTKATIESKDGDSKDGNKATPVAKESAALIGDKEEEKKEEKAIPGEDEQTGLNLDTEALTEGGNHVVIETMGALPLKAEKTAVDAPSAASEAETTSDTAENGVDASPVTEKKSPTKVQIVESVKGDSGIESGEETTQEALAEDSVNGDAAGIIARSNSHGAGALKEESETSLPPEAMEKDSPTSGAPMESRFPSPSMLT